MEFEKTATYNKQTNKNKKKQYYALGLLSFIFFRVLIYIVMSVMCVGSDTLEDQD